MKRAYGSRSGSKRATAGATYWVWICKKPVPRRDIKRIPSHANRVLPRAVLFARFKLYRLLGLVYIGRSPAAWTFRLTSLWLAKIGMTHRHFPTSLIGIVRAQCIYSGVLHLCQKCLDWYTAWAARAVTAWVYNCFLHSYHLNHKCYVDHPGRK